MFRAGVRFHIARDHHRVYQHDTPTERLRSLNWTRFKRASFPFIACDEGLIGVRARRAIIRKNCVQLWQSDIRSSPTTQRGCSTTSRRSLTRQTPTTPQHHRTTQAHARNSIARARGRSRRRDCFSCRKIRVADILGRKRRQSTTRVRLRSHACPTPCRRPSTKQSRSTRVKPRPPNTEPHAAGPCV